MDVGSGIPTAPSGSVADPGALSSSSEQPEPQTSTAEDSRPISVWNYVVRHWRGELSLPISYWINGALVSVALTLAITGALKLLPADNPQGRLVGAALVMFFVLTACVGVWQGVGIWRSSLRHVSRGGKPRWAIAARIVVAFGFIRLLSSMVHQAPVLWEGTRLLIDRDPTPPAHFQLLDRNSVVELTGGMQFGTASALQELLDKTPTVRVVRLESIGGFISEGERIGQLITDRGLSTVTLDRCASACVLAFMGGSDRLLGPKGRLGFHQSSMGGMAAPGTDLIPDRYKQGLIDRGVSPDLVDRALTVPPSQMWYPTTEELWNAHVITRVLQDSELPNP
jgi:hypothetical protein